MAGVSFQAGNCPVVHTPKKKIKCENRFVLHSLIKDRVDYFARLCNA